MPAVALAFVLVLGLAARPVQAQIAKLEDVVEFTQRAPSASDARSLGMAGTGRGGRADATALLYNPAGLGWVGQSAASGALAFIGAEEEATFGTDGMLTNADVSDYGGHFSMAYTFPTTQGSLVIGGSYNQVNTFAREFAFDGGRSSQSFTRTFLPFDDEYTINGDFIEWEGASVLPQVAYEAGAIEYFPSKNDQGNYPFDPAVLNGTSVEQIGTVGSEGRLNEVSLGGGVEAAPGVMLGLSANIAFGRYAFRNAFSELDRGDNDDYEVIRNGTVYSGLDEVRFEEHFTSDLTGANLRAGLSAEAAPGIRVGLTAETPTFYQVREVFTEAEITTFFDDGRQLSYGGRLEEQGTVENEYQVRTPWRVGAGLDANLRALTDGVADLTLAADVELVDWSQLERSSDFLSLDPGQRENENYAAVLNTNLGAEYRLGGLALRAGFAHRPDPRRLDEDVRTEPLENVVDSERIFYSLGAGYAFGNQFRLDVGWMQERFDDEFAIYPYGGGEGDLAPSITEEVTRSQLVVGATFRF